MPLAEGLHALAMRADQNTLESFSVQSSILENYILVGLRSVFVDPNVLKGEISPFLNDEECFRIHSPML